ncbi:MAG: hypothetical protein E6G97_05325 [Alphaproteobacteria bacterium]|nr:MAG: hypothetical protein E6G97_05325 [Alphaproteobacteria bacterium]
MPYGQSAPQSAYARAAQAAPKEDPRVAKFHQQVRAAANEIAANTAIIESYKRFDWANEIATNTAIIDPDKRFNRKPHGILWYFTEISVLDGATPRPNLPKIEDTGESWTTAWKKLPAVARQALCDLGNQDPRQIDLTSMEQRAALSSACEEWPEDAYATGQAASSGADERTCSPFVGEALCKALRKLKLDEKLFLQSPRGKWKFIPAGDIRKVPLFVTVPKSEIVPGQADGFVASMLEGHHVEIVVHVPANWPSIFCAIGSGRGNIDDNGKIVCGHEDRDRDVGFWKNVFLKINAKNRAMQQVLAKVKA